jgi:hypothetical protein
MLPSVPFVASLATAVKVARRQIGRTSTVEFVRAWSAGKISFSRNKISINEYIISYKN